MWSIIKYRHHDKMVSVDSELMGKHREHCLCYKCAKFTKMDEHGDFTGDADKSCTKANLLYNFVKLAGMVCPVYECGDFEPR